MEKVKYFLYNIDMKKLLIIFSSILMFLTIILFLIFIFRKNKFELNKKEITLDLESKTFEKIYTTLKNEENKKVIWASSDDNIAIVDENGKVMSIGIGETTIAALYNEEIRTINVKVVENIDAIRTTSTIGTTENTNVSTTKNNDSSILETTTTMSSSSGETITTTISQHSQTTTTGVKRISLAETMIYLKTKKSRKLTLNVYPKTLVNEKITWTSSNKDIAIVSDDGTVTAIKEGTAIITAMASNGKKTSCVVSVIKGFEDPIKPSSNENIIYSGETDSLKVYISKSSNYYLTRVWAENPYKQLNKYDSPEFGKVLYKPNILLEKAINYYSLYDKLIVGFNASGFMVKGVFGVNSVEKYPPYDKTSDGTVVITNGKVVRNVYMHAYRTLYIAGVDNDNVLRIFKDSTAITKTQIDAKKKWADEVISSGIRNTYTFGPPLVSEGKRSNVASNISGMNAKLNRQALCQVNMNNFVLITGRELNRDDLVNIMLQLKCQTGINLDGGGSIALLFKAKNSNSVKILIGSERSLPEVAYFSEL